MKGVKYMKVLKIENKKCYYSTNGNDYIKITDITKEDIYAILGIIYSTDDYLLDSVEEQTEIENDVERLIYINIYNQLQTFIENIETLKSEIHNELDELVQKYQLNEKETKMSNDEIGKKYMSSFPIEENIEVYNEKEMAGVGE